MAIPKKRWAIPLALVVLAIVLHRLILSALGGYLVKSEPPFKADVVVVLAGDDRGNRIQKGAELVKEGWAPLALVSGPLICYGNRESDLAIALAVKRGFPAAWFAGVPIEGRSTREEAREIVAELDRRHANRFILVTSNFHTRRAASVYSSLVSRDRFRTVGARDWAFNREWWRTRNGQKQVFFEWTKTVAYWFGL